MPFDSAAVSLLARASVVAAVLAALAWAFLLVFRVRRADVRHAVWSMVLIAMLAGPLVAWLAPPLTLRVGRAPTANDARTGTGFDASGTGGRSAQGHRPVASSRLQTLDGNHARSMRMTRVSEPFGSSSVM